jgi:hypothetical protein
MTRKFSWTKNVLIPQVENQPYEKTLLTQTNFNQTVSEEIQQQAKLAVKDEYTFNVRHDTWTAFLVQPGGYMGGGT